MERMRQILQQNLSIRDIEEISIKLDFSTSKVNKIIKGTYSSNSDFDKVINFSLSHLCKKYKDVLMEISNFQNKQSEKNPSQMELVFTEGTN